MQQKQTFKERLSGGPPAIGCWLELFSPLAAEIVAQAGYDCVLIDLEHGPGSYLDAISLMHAVQARPCASLLRVAANDPVEIKRAVDIGIAGIMVPVVDDRAQAEAAVASCRYPPAGRRGVAPIIVRAADYGADWRAYVDRANDELLIICQIESREAVENAAEIVSVEGVDMIFLGPFDLSANLGHMGEPDHPETRAAVEAVEASVKAAGKLLGGLPTPARSAEELYEAGYNLVLADFDAALLRDGARARVAALRAASRNSS